jgi:hypothetical protein
MLMSSLARKALTAAIVAAAGAAGSYAFRHYLERRNGRRARRDEHLDVSRWEGEGGSPPDQPAAVPHQGLNLQ